MELRERIEIQFGKRVRDERARRDWSQEELAKRLTARGIKTQASTVAKIESEGKPRAVRLAEAAAIAEEFEVSLDTLLGRPEAPERDLMYVLRALVDEASHASSMTESVESSLRDRVADVAAFQPTGAAGSIVTGCERACDALTKVREALHDTLFPPGSGTVQRLMREVLLKQLQEEATDDKT